MRQATSSDDSPCPQQATSCSDSPCTSSTTMMSAGQEGAGSVTDLLALRTRHYGPNAALNYDQPITMARGRGTYM